jgi:ATP-dependent exoDNAse (exonuclease V) beta subunit
MIQVLKNKFGHPRDQYLKLHEKIHVYEHSTDKSKYTSVTTWTHSHFPKFDADAVIHNIFHSESWMEGHKYWGMTADEIKRTWKKTGIESANAGTKLHARIEEFMNDKRFDFDYTHKDLYEMYNKQPDTQVEWDYFIEFVKNTPHLKPYRTEWMIFDEDLKIAGSIDMVYENPDGTLMIYDWKRCKDIDDANWYFASNPVIGHIPNNKFWHYTLQLNTYKMILERKYNKTVTTLCLIRLHPNAESYEQINIPIITDDMNNLFNERNRLLFEERMEKIKI